MNDWSPSGALDRDRPIGFTEFGAARFLAEFNHGRRLANLPPKDADLGGCTTFGQAMTALGFVHAVPTTKRINTRKRAAA